ncbi:MAG: MBL fold metallo-hydrolase [Actinomycetota bacterium]|nr:MBL fold metallo-hydrolase [Actinomycetota bacterium]
MRLTHLGHACLLVETGSTRVLIDPGTYSTGFDALRDLDAILVTHMHPDHIDPERFPALVRSSPRARLLIEPEAAATHEIEPAAGFTAGDSTTIGELQIQAIGGVHATNHDKVPPVGNIGFVLRDGAGHTLFHPGDSYAETPADIDVLGLPLNAPWCRMRETLAFVEAVSPRVAVPIHDALLSDRGHAAYLMHVEEFSPDRTAVEVLGLGETYDV